MKGNSRGRSRETENSSVKFLGPQKKMPGRVTTKTAAPKKSAAKVAFPVSAAHATGKEIAKYLNSHLAPLQRFIERELLYRETSGQLSSGEVSCDEVLDEVVASALDHQHQRPQLLSVQRWMYRLALQELKRVAKAGARQPAAVPLEQSARKQNVKASDEPELQFHQPDEMLHGEDVIADRRAATPEDIAASDEMIALVERSLRHARKEDREAFILYAIEGFTYQEIAATTDRGHDSVKASVEAAREWLKKSLPKPSPFREAILRSSHIA